MVFNTCKFYNCVIIIFELISLKDFPCELIVVGQNVMEITYLKNDLLEIPDITLYSACLRNKQIPEREINRSLK